MIVVWHLHRRGLTIAAALVAGLIALLLGAALVIHLSGGDRTVAQTPARRLPTLIQGTHAVAPSSAGTATDAPRWDAMATVTPATSAAFPAVLAGASDDPSSFAQAFATELFTRDYTKATRAQLVSWAQYEDSPLRSTNYPQPDWTKVLVDSLTDITWDQADDTPVPADGQWLALRAQGARDSVSDVRVVLDPQWEQGIATGYSPPDPLSTVRDVTLTVTRHSGSGHSSRTSRFAVALSIQLGTGSRGGYGVATTNNYVTREA